MCVYYINFLHNIHLQSKIPSYIIVTMFDYNLIILIKNNSFLNKGYYDNFSDIISSSHSPNHKI